MSNLIEGAINGAGLKIAIISTRWNEFVVESLTNGAKRALIRAGVADDNIDIIMAPGAYEVPFVARQAAKSGRYDGIVALGAVIRGATPHFDYVAGEAASGIANAARDTDVPISFGVLTVDTIEQAIERAGTKAGNKGEEAALATLEVVSLCRSLKE